MSSRLPPPFGPFSPLRRLGAGGMAETFVAVRRGPGGFEQHVCIKRILPAFEHDVEFVESFLNEAKTSAALRHGNIVQVLDFGVADGSHYLALELIEGLDLRALLNTDGDARVTLDPELCTLVAADLCAALEHAHTAAPGRTAVVHRDVSPSNVLISCAGEVKLTDFGIARATSGRQRTATGIIKGKVPYMPPEYIEHGTFDPRGDLFSLGVLLYEVLGGVRPFDGHSDLDTIRRIVAGQRAHIGALARGAPPQLLQCIEGLLTLRPEQRYASARAVLEALPGINTHRVRRRLGDLVREQLSQLSTPPDPSANTLPRGEVLHSATPHDTPRPAAQPALHSPGTQPLTPSRPPLQALETGTRVGPSRRSTRPWWALGAAGALLTLVGALALWRGLQSTELTTQQPRPTLPQTEPVAAPAPSEALKDWPPPTTQPSAPGVHVVTAEEVLPPTEGAPMPAPVAATPEAMPSTHADKPRLHGKKGKSTRDGQAPRTTPDRAPASAAADAPAELKIHVLPYGDVWIDGKRLGQAPVTVKLPAGAHEIGVGDGRPREKRSITLGAGESTSVEIHRKDVEGVE